MRWLAALLVVVLALGGAGFAAWRTYDAPGPLPQARAVIVPRGGLDQVSDALLQAGVIASAWPLQAAATLTRTQGALKAGELEFPAAASLHQVLTVLRTSRPVQHHLTLPEGLTAAQVTALVERAPALDGETPRPAGRAVPGEPAGRLAW